MHHLSLPHLSLPVSLLQVMKAEILGENEEEEGDSDSDGEGGGASDSEDSDQVCRIDMADKLKHAECLQ